MVIILSAANPFLDHKDIFLMIFWYYTRPDMIILLKLTRTGATAAALAPPFPGRVKLCPVFLSPVPAKGPD